MAPQPSFVAELWARPLLRLQPPKLTDSANPPWSPTLKASIADARLHPLIEATLHIMNDDLFSAHFLLRKLQEDDWGKWLHGILHAREGDMCNAKCWYRDVPDEVLQLVYKPGLRGGEFAKGSLDAHVLASHVLDGFSLAIGKRPSDIRKATEESNLVPEVGKAFSEAELHELAQKPHDIVVHEARDHLWRELTSILEHLVSRHGWCEWDGTEAYTKDSQGMKEKGRVLGEGWRSF